MSRPSTCLSVRDDKSFCWILALLDWKHMASLYNRQRRQASGWVQLGEMAVWLCSSLKLGNIEIIMMELNEVFNLLNWNGPKSCIKSIKNWNIANYYWNKYKLCLIATFFLSNFTAEVECSFRECWLPWESIGRDDFVIESSMTDLL